MKPIIEINDFSGGMTLSEKKGRIDQFRIGEKLDFSSRPGKLAPGHAWTTMTLTGTSTIPTGFNSIVHAKKDGELYYAGRDTKIYYRNTLATILMSTDSDQTGVMRDMEEFDGKLMFLQNTTLGIKDLTAATNAGYTFNFKTGFANKTYHPIHIQNNVAWIGNGQYVGKATTLDTSADISTNALDLVGNWNVRALADFGYRYLAIGANYGSESVPLKSKIFLWDRIASSWNDEISLPETEIKALKYTAGYLWAWGGKSCNLYVIPEGSRAATKVFSFGRENPQYEHEVYPKAVVAQKGTIYFALSKVKEASSVRNPAGIYSFPADPNKFSLNLVKKRNGYDERYYSLGLCRGDADNMIHASLYDSVATKYYLDRENLAANESFYKDSATYESFTYSAPAGQQIITEKFGVEFEPLPSLCLVSFYYKKDNDTSWTAIFSNFQTDDAYEKIVKKYLRCDLLKLKLTLKGSAGMDANRPFVKRIYVLGGLTSKP